MFPGARLGVMAVASVVIPVASAVILSAHSMPASAAADTPVTLRKIATEFCLGSNGKDSNDKDNSVVIGKCKDNRDSDKRQQWVLSSSGTTLSNVATGHCLESNDSKQVYTNNCSNSSSYQKWVLGSGTTLRNLATGLCLGSGKNNDVYANQCDDSASQKWSGI